MNGFLLGLRALRTLLAAIIVLAAGTLISSVYLEQAYTRTSAFVQPVLTDRAGPVHPAGTPAMMVVPDARAFVQGSGAFGARLVSVTFLHQHGIRLMPLRPALLVLGLARASALFFAWAAAVAWLLLYLQEVRRQPTFPGRTGGTIRA